MRVDRARAGRWLPALPAVLLLAVACAQVALARQRALSPWKGGGFGMFSTLDARPFRYLRVTVTAPQRSEELRIPASLEDAAAAAEVLPTDARLGLLAARIVERERARGRPATDVRIEVWRDEFEEGSLRPRPRRMRAFAFHALD